MVYYNLADRESFYFALGTVGNVHPIDGSGRLFRAEVENFCNLPICVPYAARDGYFEKTLISRAWRSETQRIVRPLSSAELDTILAFCVSETQSSNHGGLSDQEQSVFISREREIISRMKRLASLRSRVTENYEYKCALTGVGQRDRWGNLEADVCHLIPVEDGGPDIPENSILLMKSLHWAFDRHLISLTDDLRIMTKSSLDPAIKSWLNHTGFARSPTAMAARLGREFLAYHRAHFDRFS